MTNTKKLILTIGTILLFTSSAFAKGAIEHGVKNCGWVGMGAKKETMNVSSNIVLDGLVFLGSSPAATSSVTSTASSGTSNTSCAGGGSASTQEYIYRSYVFLEEDISRGEGPHLNALANLFECPQDKRPSLFLALREHTFSTNDINISDDQEEKAKRIYYSMQSQAHKHCYSQA